MKTIGAALAWARKTLSDSDSPHLDAQTLLAWTLDVQRVYLLAHREEALDGSALREYATLVRRRALGEPIAYITGRKAFYDSDFSVNRHVLIPRPETELLLEEGLRLMRQNRPCRVADIGTGCGALAVTFARHVAGARVFAADISDEALCLARENAALHAVDIDFMRGDLASPLIARGIKVDLVLANLPYIATDELKHLAVSRHEPRLALDGGADGLVLIRRLLRQLAQICHPGAWALLEIGADQGAAARALVAETCGVSADILRDYAGLDRIARLQL